MKYQRSILKDVEGYVPGEQPKLLNIIKLNTNENPYPPSPRALEVLHTLSSEALRRYPDPVLSDFRTECAKRYGLDGPEWVLAGNGMDELLSLAVRTFVDPRERILSPYPTYILYETLAQLQGAECVFVDLDDTFHLTETFFHTPAKLCFLPRPNSPTGVCCSRTDVERLCREFDGIVVIDEAYADFADDNCMDFPKRFNNAIVMRTFSKSFSMAGLRLGTMAACPDIIQEFIKVKDSYNVNSITQALGLAAMQDYDYMRTSVEKVKATRQHLTDALTKLGFQVSPSQSNFVFAQWNGTPDARHIFEALRERAIIVRYFPLRKLANGLRISIGTDAEMETLLNALEEIIHS